MLRAGTRYASAATLEYSVRVAGTKLLDLAEPRIWDDAMAAWHREALIGNALREQAAMRKQADLRAQTFQEAMAAMHQETLRPDILLADVHLRYTASQAFAKLPADLSRKLLFAMMEKDPAIRSGQMTDACNDLDLALQSGGIAIRDKAQRCAVGDLILQYVSRHGS